MTATKPQGTETRVRHVRVPDAIWLEAAANANAEGLTISELVRMLLREYNQQRQRVRRGE